MIIKFLFALLITFGITDKEKTMNDLQAQVTEAQKTVGLAETMDYVEMIGRIKQLKDQIAELEYKKKEILHGKGEYQWLYRPDTINRFDRS